MKIKEVYQLMIDGEELPNMPKEDYRALVWYAQHKTAKSVCDRANAELAEMRKRASDTRFKHLANSVIGTKKKYLVYDHAYSDDEIGEWDVTILS